MTIRAILTNIFLLTSSATAFAIQASTSHTLFYKKQKNDSTQLGANILLSWRVANSSLHFTKNNKGLLSAELVCLLRVSTEQQIIKEETFIINTPPVQTPEDAFYQIIADQYEYALNPGHYDIELVLYEQDYKNELYQYSDTITVERKNERQTFLSGIQLLDTFFKTDATNIYTKNGFLNLPKPSNFIDDKKNNIQYYFEIYQADKNPTENNPLLCYSYLSWKPFDSPIPQYEYIDTLQSTASIQNIYHFFDIKKLKSGNYYINNIIKDKYDLIIDKKSLFIQRYNSRPLNELNTTKESDTTIDELKNSAHILDLTNTFVAKYNASQVRAILKMLLLICDKNEGISINGFLNKPDELYSKYFIYNFWEKRDKLYPEKAWKAYTEKIKEVNKLFKGAGQSGYETDRGRIYIQYGKPNDRIIVNNESGALPYEIWQYYSTEKQGQEGIFLLYKPGRALGDYQLLHSTVVGERRNSNWRALLYNNSITGSGNINTDSQAEQYLRNK